MAFVESTARGGIFTSRSTSRVRASRVLIAMAILIGAVAWPVQTAEQVTFSVVADFGASLPYLIVGPLVRDADGTIYGTGQVGGAFNRGGVFKVDPSGVLTSLYDFSGADGEFPASGLVRGADGALYGTTNGGAGNTTGTIFRITTAGSLTTLHTFSARDDMTGEMAEGGEPETPLAAAADGSLYGIAHTRGDFDNGILFQITPAGAFTIVHAFGSEAVPLAQPRGGVVFGSDNALYGAVAAGGEFSAGGLYRMTTGGSVGLLHSFAADGSEGSEVRAPLTDGGDSALYGTASSGGTSNLGTVFSVTPGGTFTVLHSFAAFDPGTSTYPEGFAPGDGVTLANDGNLYGVTSSGGANMLGTIFRIERASQTFSVRKHLQDEGGSVVAPLIAGDDGKLYGASTTGGPSPYGAVFSFDPATSGSQIVLGFRANNPGQLFAGLTRGDDGLLYGVGYDGGGAARGSIFRISEQGSVTLLHLFTGSDGLNPFAHLVKGPDGSLYGTTVFGGNSRGTVFKVTSAGTFVPVYAFADFTAGGQTDGMYPYGSLAIDPDGTVYGVTSAGGENNGGTLFKIVNGSFSVVYAFGAAAPGTGLPTGYAPMGGLTWGADGRLYGTTTAGGDEQRGTVFSYDPVSGVATDLASFGQGTGYFPRSELLLASDGNFYGTAVGDGAGYGTIFRFEPQSGQIASIHNFSNGSDGATSFAPLVQAADQSLYGTTTMGGDTGAGTLFRLTLDGTFTPLHSFDYSQPGGVSPSGGLLETLPGTFYGTTPSGSGNLPVVFRLTIGQQNHAPVAHDVAVQAKEDTAFSDTLPASDDDHDPITFSLLTNGSKGAATVTNAATGAFTYAPKSNANGTDTFTFQVNDGKASSNVATVTVTIAPVNDAPVASNGAASVTAGSSTSGTLSATDIDSTSLTYQVVANGSKGAAVVTNPATGAFTYTANADASGSDSFTFKASDGQASSNVATVTVTIQPARLEGFVAINGTLSLPEDGRGRGAVHATDSKHRRLTYQIVSSGKKGWVYLDGNSGQFLYLPKRNANGEDRFTFRARAGNQWSNVATVAVVITPVNDPPWAWGPCVRVLRRGQTSGKVQAVDPDGDPLTFSLAKAPKFGTVTLTANGGFTYVADSSRNHDAFTIKVSDPAGAFTLVRVVVLRRW